MHLKPHPHSSAEGIRECAHISAAHADVTLMVLPFSGAGSLDRLSRCQTSSSASELWHRGYLPPHGCPMWVPHEFASQMATFPPHPRSRGHQQTSSMTRKGSRQPFISPSAGHQQTSRTSREGLGDPLSAQVLANSLHKRIQLANPLPYVNIAIQPQRFISRQSRTVSLCGVKDPTTLQNDVIN